MTPTRCIRLPSASILVFAVALGATACSSSADDTGAAGNGPGGSGPGGSGPAGSGPGGSTAGGGGSTGSAGTTGIAGGPAGTTGNAGSGPAGSGGAPAGTAGSTAGAGGSTGVGGATAGRGGSAAGGSGVGGATAGRGGSAAGGAGVGGATAGRGGSAAGGAPAGGSTGTTGCPSNATFCSGFEESTQPAGSVYKVNAAPGEWTRDFAVDTNQKKNGNSSLRVKSGSDSGTSGSMYKMLAVPATQGAFWARFWIRSDVDLGGEHNAFAEASESDDPNASGSVEFAEDVGIAFNTSDDVRWPAGYGRLTSGGTNPYVLAKNTWHCVELSFDATAKIQQAYVNGTQLMNATNYPSSPKAYKIFKFGFMSFHGPNRQLWYDDVAVAPTRVGGCPTP